MNFNTATELYDQVSVTPYSKTDFMITKTFKYAGIEVPIGFITNGKRT